MNWLYTHNLPVADCDWSQMPSSGCVITYYKESELSKVRCVIFGDSYIATRFQIACEHSIIADLVHAGVYLESIILAFAKLPSTNNILEAMVDSHVHYYNEVEETVSDKELHAQLPHDFLVQVMIRYSQVAKKQVKTTLHECDYHHHANDQEKDGCHGEETEF